MATRMPTGKATAAASATMITVPTMAFSIPPPVWPNVTWFCVKRSRLRAGIPFRRTETTTMPRTLTARKAEAVAIPWAKRLTRSLRRDLPVALSEIGATDDAISVRRLDRVAPDDQLRGEVGDQRHREEDHAQVEEGCRLEERGGALVLVGDVGGQRVASLEEIGGQMRRRAAHLRHGDCLSHGATAAEQDGRDQSAARVRKHHSLDHLPAREPEPDRALLDLLRHLQEQVAADRRGDWDDHDRQHEHRREHRAARVRPAGEERRPAEGRVEPRPELVVDDRAEDEDPPEPEDDARNRRQHLDERPDDAADAARRELAQVEPDRDRDGRREEEGEGTRVDRAEDEVDRAVLVCDGVPGLMPDECEAELADRRPRTVDDLVDDQADQRDTTGGGDARYPLKRDVADLVESATARLEGLLQPMGRRRFHRGQHCSVHGTRRAASPCRHHLFTTSRPERREHSSGADERRRPRGDRASRGGSR